MTDLRAADPDDDVFDRDDLDPNDDLDTDESDDEEEWVGEDEPVSGQEALFVGDIGGLPNKVRETMITLLRRRYISADRQPSDWRIVLDYETALRTRLNDLFLDLVIDTEYQVAYKRQAVSETGRKFPTLLYDQAYNREETILLVHLRRLIRTRQKQGDDAVFVDRAELLEQVSHYRPLSATNHVRDNQATARAIDALLKNDILLRTKVEDRYRVSSIIEVLMPVDAVKALAAWLKAENATVDGADPDDACDPADFGDLDGLDPDPGTDDSVTFVDEQDEGDRA